MKKNSPMKQMIKESLREMKGNQDGGFPDDPLLEANHELTGPERFAKGQKAKDEIVIDSQLADIQNKEGYFLKLKKELRPGEWMLMKTIETEWRKWPDIESEVAKIVQDHTKKAPSKWGSGPYRIEYACKNGIRGKNYPNVDMHINAEEEFINGGTGTNINASGPVDAATAVAGQIDTLANLVGMLKNFLPQTTDPSKTQDQIASAFKDGMALKINEGSSSNAMMATMMTGLIGMMTAVMTKNNEIPRIVNPEEKPTDILKGMLDTLKTFGVLGQNQIKEKTIIDFVTELKALGMDLFEKKDPIAQMGQLKQLANIAGEFMGMGGNGEKPGILEKIVDIVGPSIPGMIKDMKETASNAVAVQVEAGKNIERAKMIGPQQSENIAQMNIGTSSSVSSQIIAFFNGLYDAVNQNNRMFYPVVYTSLLQDTNGQTLLQGIITGTHTAKEVIELLQVHGGDRYRESEFVMKKLVSYINGFIIWIRDMTKPQSSGMNAYGGVSRETVQESNSKTKPSATSFDAQCPLCQTVFAFENEQSYIEEKEKECGIERNGVICPGLIQPIVKAS